MSVFEISSRLTVDPKARHSIRVPYWFIPLFTSLCHYPSVRVSLPEVACGACVSLIVKDPFLPLSFLGRYICLAVTSTRFTQVQECRVI